MKGPSHRDCMWPILSFPYFESAYLTYLPLIWDQQAEVHSTIQHTIPHLARRIYTTRGNSNSITSYLATLRSTLT